MENYAVLTKNEPDLHMATWVDVKGHSSERKIIGINDRHYHLCR